MASLRKTVLLDKGTDMSERGGVESVAEVLSSVMTEHGHSQSSLGRLIGEKQQTISKWARGESEPSLDDIANIEEKLELWRGTILRRAGYVADPTTAREAIEADPVLTHNQKLNLLDIYDGAVRRRR